MIYYESELCHHGIKGMKWGVRRFQNKDGSLTPAGKKRYNDVDSNKATKTKDPKSKSAHRIRLEKKYQEAGLTKEEAIAAADKRIKIEKVLAVSAAVTVTACTAYYAKNKYLADHCDQILKAGTTFHNLDAVANERPGEHLYVNYRKNDTDFFRGQFALGKLKRTGEVYNHELTAVKDVKIPSLDTRKKTFKELYDNDKEFREVFKKHSGLGNKEVNAETVYNKMWRKFGDKDNQDFNVAKRKYFDSLQKKGYDAVVDEWDTKKTVYRADAPLILLNTSSESFGKMNIRQLTDKDILLAQANSKYYVAMRHTLNSLILPHTNHFKESELLLARQAAKSEKNSKYIDKAIEGINSDEILRRMTFGKEGEMLVKAGKYMEKHKNANSMEAINKIRKQQRIINNGKLMVEFVGANTIPYAAVYGAGKLLGTSTRNTAVARYLKEHPNTKLTTDQLNQRFDDGKLR